MGFSGPGIYEIVPYQKPTLNVNSWGGQMAPGEEVKTYPREPLTDNALWELAIASGSGDNAEYHILNVRTGYYLTGDPVDQVTKVLQKSPRDKTTRWKLKFSPTNGYDVWTINSVANNTQLNVAGSSLEPGAEILNWQVENGDNTKFYFDPRK